MAQTINFSAIMTLLDCWLLDFCFLFLYSLISLAFGNIYVFSFFEFFGVRFNFMVFLCTFGDFSIIFSKVLDEQIENVGDPMTNLTLLLNYTLSSLIKAYDRGYGSLIDFKSENSFFSKFYWPFFSKFYSSGNSILKIGLS